MFFTVWIATYLSADKFGQVFVRIVDKKYFIIIDDNIIDVFQQAMVLRSLE
jgi:hypothetical protein